MGVKINDSAWFEEVINHSNDAIFTETLGGVITSWNAAATDLFGYQQHEVIGNNVSALIPDDKTGEEKQIADAVARGEKIADLETIRNAKDGTQRTISLTVTPIKTRDGVIAGLAKIAKDISVRARAERDQARLAAIVSSSDDAIISKTLDGIITSWNEAAEKLFGYSEQEAIGRHISLIIPPDRLDEENMIIGRLKSGLKVDHFETIRVAKDGSERYISLTISPIRDKSGRIIGASKIARDIELNVLAQREREHYIERLRELNKYKDDFMVMASHELKTPLTVILANLQVLEQMVVEEKNLFLLRKIIDKAFGMSRLISNLLDVSKVQVARLELKKINYNFLQQVEEVVASLKETTQLHALRLQYSGPPQCIIYADKERMQHVLINLIENAIKYSPEGGDISVSLIHDGSQIKLKVEDQGVGIHADDLENIFQRFYRGKIASSFSGSGIGLFLSSEVVKDHGGKISVKSQEGVGTEFTLVMPVAASDAAPDS